MTKSLFISPDEERAKGLLRFQDIPVNAYQKTMAEAAAAHTREELCNIYRDMVYIRTFESMLYAIKAADEYQGIRYFHPGPAHLGIGQEAAYVGGAFYLGLNDATFGSHRSHGEILAKGLRTIETAPEDVISEIIRTYADGRIFAAIDRGQPIREAARDFLLYGAICEVFGKANGFNSGLGGSMHAFFPPFGIYPNNAIVGGSAPMAVGAALFKRVNHQPGVVICNIGDGAMACGPVWEGLNISAMDQVRTLWEEKGGIPILFHINNNFYGMGGQTAGETMGYQTVARIAAAFSTQLHAERIDGYNPLAVMDAYKRKLPLAQTEGPVLLDVMNYRLSAHSVSEVKNYRTEEEVAAWSKQDPIPAYAKELISCQLADEAQLLAIRQSVEEDIRRNLALAVREDTSPRIALFGAQKSFVADHMFSNKRMPSLDTRRSPEVLLPKADSPRLHQIKRKARAGRDEQGRIRSAATVYQVRDALFEPILDKFYEDPTFVTFGEEARDWGGAFAVYRGLTEVLPYHRLFNTPIAEAGIIGAAVGYAVSGGRALVELMYCDFMGRAADELFNQLAKWQAMSAGVLKMPVVVRMSVGSKYGAQHSQDWSALCAHIPGLKVVFPVTPYDAKGLMTAALNGTDPVIFLESQRVYDMGELFHPEGVPEEAYELEIGEPDIKRAGSDITILTIGATLYRALEAADILQEQFGISAEVIDARSLVPFNYRPVVESVRKTGRILIAGDACERNSFMRNMASVITELCFDELDAPPAVVGARNWITPPHELETAFFPQPEWIIAAIHQRLLPLPGYVPEQDFSENALYLDHFAGV